MSAGPEIADLERAISGSGMASSDYDLNKDAWPQRNGVPRDAAVLILARHDPGGLHLVMTKRARGLRHHPGQIAFPGGKIDPSDADAPSAALREAHEEIGLDPASVRVLGALPPHETVTGFSVTPVVAVVTGRFEPVADPGEVQEVFSVPLSFVASRANFRIERRMWRGAWRRYDAVPFGPYYIWGATARILRALSDRMVPEADA